MNSKILDLDNEKIKNISQKILKTHQGNKSNIIGECYRYVRDEIKFGYNSSDDIKASQVLNDGYGQCNTKSTLLMSLLISCGIDVRLHGFMIDKRLQYGAITGIFYKLAPAEILHSWVEVNYEGQWLNLEGFILDNKYLNSLQEYIGPERTTFCGYGVACKNINKPENEWIGGNSTYIQKEAIVRDLGLYKNPDDFYRINGTNPKGFRKYLFMYFIRFIMNRRIERIRKKAFKGELRTVAEIDEIKKEKTV